MIDQIVFVQGGATLPPLHAAVIETLNNYQSQQLSCYERSKYGFKLVAQQLDTCNVSIVPYDTFLDERNPPLSSPTCHLIDVASILSALSTHQYITIASYSDQPRTHDRLMIPNIKYLTRDDNGQVIDAISGEVILTQDVGYIVVFCTMFRLSKSNTYVLVTNPDIITSISGFDCFDQSTVYKVISSTDVDLKRELFTPVISGAKLVGDNILVKDNNCEGVTFSFFSHPSTLVSQYPHLDLVNSLMPSVTAYRCHHVTDATSGRVTLHQTDLTKMSTISFDFSHHSRVFTNLTGLSRMQLSYIVI